MPVLNYMLLKHTYTHKNTYILSIKNGLKINFQGLYEEKF